MKLKNKFPKKYFLLVLGILLLTIFFKIKTPGNAKTVSIAQKEQQSVSSSRNENSNEPQIKITQSASPKDIVLDKMDSDILLGNPNAPVTIIEYSSFTCPHCVHMHNNIITSLKKDFIDQNKVKYLHRPMVNQTTIFGKILQNCVNQKDFYALTKDLFNLSDQWAYSENMLDQLKILATKYGLNEQQFSNCVNDKQLGQTIIDNQIQATKILDIKYTPTIFINKDKYVGALTYSELKNIINKKLNEQK